MTESRAMTDDAAYALFDLISSHRITSAIYVTVKLGLADLLVAGPKTGAELAHATQADEAAIERLMRALVTLGICRIEGARFALTEVGTHLAASSPRSLQAWALFEAEMLQPSWGDLVESVRTGKTRAELAGAASSFDLMSRDPGAVATFNAAMADVARLLTPAVVAYDFSAHTMLIDVGGGTGELLVAILQSHPRLRGAIFDLARCADAAGRRIADRNLGDRAQFIAGDFFQSVPGGADILTLKSVIHDWDDARAAQILRNCRRALPAGGRILLVERVMPETPADRPLDRASALSDLNMLRGPGGRERTEAEYRRLLTVTGFHPLRVTAAQRYCLIEATAT
jgi:hypothetical protein